MKRKDNMPKNIDWIFFWFLLFHQEFSKMFEVNITLFLEILHSIQFAKSTRYTHSACKVMRKFVQMINNLDTKIKILNQIMVFNKNQRSSNQSNLHTHFLKF